MIQTILVLPLIVPFVLWGAVALGGLIFGGKLLMDHLSDGDKIAILGMRESGKTLFLRTLQGKPYLEYKSSGFDEYEGFDLQVGDKTIKICAGVDIGGTKNYRTRYDELMSNAAYVFYFFDISKYLNDFMYRRECNSRFKDIYDKKGERAIYLASHRDLVPCSDDELKSKFREHLIGKSYGKISDKAYYVNLTDKEQINKLNKIFFVK